MRCTCSPSCPDCGCGPCDCTCVVVTDHKTVTHTRLPEPIFTVQEWLARPLVATTSNKPLRYAMWWINKHLASIQEKLSTLDFDGGHRLYVTYADIRHRVMGVDRLGMIDLVPLTGNSLDRCKCQIVRETDFTDWSNTFEGPLDESKFVPYVPSVVERLNAATRRYQGEHLG